MDADAYPQEVWRTKSRSIFAGRSRWRSSGGNSAESVEDVPARDRVDCYRRVAGAGLRSLAAHFLFPSPEMALIHPEQMVVAGNHYVTPRSVLRDFRAPTAAKACCAFRSTSADARSKRFLDRAGDRASRDCRIEIEVEISERTPIAFLRQSNDMALWTCTA